MVNLLVAKVSSDVTHRCSDALFPVVLFQKPPSRHASIRTLDAPRRTRCTLGFEPRRDAAISGTVSSELGQGDRRSHPPLGRLGCFSHEPRGEHFKTLIR